MEHQAPSRRSKLYSRPQARAARASPTQDLGLAGGQALLEKPKLSKWSLRRLRLDVLRELGQANGVTLSPLSKGQKQDWIDALVSYHQSRHPTPDFELRSSLRVVGNRHQETPDAEMQEKPSEHEVTMSTFIEVDRSKSDPRSFGPPSNTTPPRSHLWGEQPSEVRYFWCQAC